MNITVTSTTDTEADVAAAQGGLSPEKVLEKKSETEETPVETPEDSESPDELDGEDADQDDDKEEKPDEEVKPKKKGGFKRRIDKLNTKLSAAEQKAEYWRQEALKNKSAEPEKPSPAEKPNPSDRPTAEQFESHEDYVEALADWKVDQKLSARDKANEESKLRTAHESRVKTHVERVQTFAEDHDDFQELMESVDDIPMSPTVQQVILDSDNGPELMYALAKNREEYKRICSLPAIACARELGKFEARIKSSSAPDAPIKTTKAPKPINPVGNKSSKTSTKSPDDMSFDEFKRWRAQNPNE